MKKFMKLVRYVGCVILTVVSTHSLKSMQTNEGATVVAQTTLLPTKLSVGLTATTPMPTAKASKPSDVSDGRRAFNDLLKSLRRFGYNSKSIAIPLPIIDQDLVVSCTNETLGGSGNIFMPLPDVVIEIKTRTANSEITLKDALTALAKNEISKHSVQLPLLQWLSQSKPTALKTLAVKLMVLLICKIQHKQTPPVKKEIARLLVRLSLSENLNLFGTKPLSAFIPNEIREFIKIFCPSINSRSIVEKSFEFMDNFWNLLTHNASNSQITTSSTRGNVYCFILKDPTFAQQCETYFSKYDQTADIVSQFEDFATSNGYQIVDDKKEFDRYDHVSTPADGTYDATKPLIGFRSLGAMPGTQDVPAEVTSAIKAAKETNKALRINAFDGKTWIVFVTNSFGKMDAISLAILSVAKTFKQYAQAKKDLMASNEEIRTAVEQQEQHNARVRAFLKTEIGLNALVAIESGVEEILKQNAPVANTQVESLKKEIVNLKDQAQAKKSLILSLQSRPANSMSMALQQAHAARIDKINSEIAVINETIAQKQTQIAASENMIQRQREEAVKNKKDLELLQQESGDAYLLESEITAEQASDTTKEPLDQILLKRNKVAKLYQQEAFRLQKEVAQKQTELAAQGKSQIMQKINLEKYSAFIAELKKAAATLTQENEQIRDLLECKSLLKSDVETEPGLTSHMAELDAFVGHIFIAKTAKETIRPIKDSYANEFVMFVKDLNSNVKEFKQIKNELISTLKWISQNTEHIKANMPMYQYLLNCFKWYLPELMPLVAQI